MGSEWVGAPGSGRLIRIVSKGLTGPVDVKGQTYAINSMVAVGDSMIGDETVKAQNIADILLYIRKTFGNKVDNVDAVRVLAVRKSIADRTTPFTAAELKATLETE